MPKYSVLLEGKNFPIKTGGKTELMGFYTTRRVKASTEKEAELLAVATIKNDASLISTMDKTSEAEPKIYMESITELQWWSRLNSIGYTFFPIESE